MNTKPLRTLVAAALGLAAMLTSGCNMGSWSWTPPIKAKQAVTATHIAGKGLAIESINGAIQVSTGGDEVTIDAELAGATQERLDQIKVKSERLTDGTLRIWVDWPGGKPQGNEGASLVVKVPDAEGLRIMTSNGSITVTDLGGDADLHTSNGSVRVDGQGGAVTAKCSNGSIVIEHPAGAVIAHTSNGKIEVTGAPSTVTADTSNGPVEVSLASSAVGPVNIDTSNGSIKLFLSPSFAGELTASTSNGRVRLPETAAVVTKTRSRATARFGNEVDVKPSTLKSSNGNITIQVR